MDEIIEQARQYFSTFGDSEMLKSLLVYDAAHPLLFNTGLFLVLFTCFILIYSMMSRSNIIKKIFVILFSLYFYYKSSYTCCFILLGVCVSDYVLGHILGNTSSSIGRRAIVALNVIINVGMLVYFKYFNLLYETFASITGTSFDPLDIVLPAGISFFTFRSISYIVDIYRHEMEPCRNFLDYVFYLTFFPPLLAGPVVRAKDMLPQVEANPAATRAMVSEGLFLIICGLVKKVVIADYISGNFVDRIFENPSLYSGFENLMGTIGFTIQIYCDFSGYSDMAIGLALLLGYRFKDNFDAPFKSASPTEFWRRWHISLSSWLRDYIYIPLGGNRHGKVRQHINLMTTMVIGGLWHGASWMFFIWGAFQGAILIGHKTLTSVFHASERWRRSALATAGNVFITMVLVIVGFTIFRAESMERLGEMSRQIFLEFHPDIIPQFIVAYALITLAILAGYLMHFAPRSWTTAIKGGWARQPLFIQAIALAIVLFIIIQTRQSELVPFVYLRY